MPLDIPVQVIGCMLCTLVSPCTIGPLLRQAMAAHVLHFGDDDYHRISILESAGYRVEQCKSLIQLTVALKAHDDPEAIFLTESEVHQPEDAATLARESTLAPVILFRTGTVSRSEADFDLIVPTLASPQEWLHDVQTLIDCSRKIRARSQALIQQSARLRMESSAVRQEFH